MARVASFFSPWRSTSRNGRGLLVVLALMIGLGTMSVMSASEGQSLLGNSPVWSYALRHFIYLALGGIAFYLSARVRLERALPLAKLFIIVCIALLITVSIHGATVNGGTRWLVLGPFSFQPSEAFKLACVLYAANLVSSAHRDIRNWVQLVRMTWPIWVGLALILVGKDIGTTSVAAAIVVSILAIAGLPRALLIRFGLLSVAGFAVLYKSLHYVRVRVSTFIHHDLDPTGVGWQLRQSKIALGSGGWTGVGLGHSQAKWGLLPNSQTDFIYSIIGQEWGFVGSLAVIVLFVVFLAFALQILRSSRSSANRLVAVGVTVWIGFQAVVNIASVIGLWPVTGIPLPFFSYGGTALIMQLAAAGLLHNVANDPSRSGAVSLAHVAVSTHAEPSVRHRGTHRRIATPVDGSWDQ